MGSPRKRGREDRSEARKQGSEETEEKWEDEGSKEEMKGNELCKYHHPFNNCTNM